MRHYEYRHRVTFQETNLVGNVYYTNHLGWQGRCRELFLQEHTPEIIAQLGQDLCLATVRCSCEYLAELFAFDEVIIRMRLIELVQNRMRLGFEYWRCRNGTEELIARGEQEVAVMRHTEDRLVAAPVPETLREALSAYA